MIRISASDASTNVRSASCVKVSRSPEPLDRLRPSVPSAVCPSCAICTSIPLSSSQVWTLASVAFASSTISGTLSRNADTWSATGLDSTMPIVPTTQTTPSITITTASWRGTRARWSSVTNGLSSSATRPPMTNSRITGPAALRTAQRTTTASGSVTSWIQRGTTTRPSGMAKVWSGQVPNILFIGDVVARAGRRTVRDLLPGLREELGLDFVVANGENAAGGIGITPKEADELFKTGVDVITLGNHTYRHREVWPYLDQEPHILRPANFLRTQPGRGTCVVERDGVSLGVVNLSGNLFMQAGSPPLVAIDDALKEVSGADLVLVDMHAEATSEKVALGWYLDGKVTAVVGTHTHVPTADARVLPGGTAYITDVGMTGARGGVIGVRREQSIAVMRTHMPMRYEPSEEDPWLNGVLIRASAPRRADEILQLLRPAG